jgi:hypothetical protein
MGATEYWKKRCKLAESVIRETNPGPAQQQTRAYQEWKELKEGTK